MDVYVHNGLDVNSFKMLVILNFQSSGIVAKSCRLILAVASLC